MEIYKGRPIFYGLGNFFWSDIQEPLSSELHGSAGNRALLRESFADPDGATDADLSAMLNATSFATSGDTVRNRTFQTMLARSRYDIATGRLKEVRLYPIDLGYGDRLTRSGIPRRASKTIADSVLDRVITMSDRRSVRIEKRLVDGYWVGIATPR